MTLQMPRQVIHSLDEIPVFQSEDEERAFWAAHEVSDELAAAAEPIPDDELPPVRSRTRPTTIRLEEQALQRLKAIATQQGTRYQTLLKRWLDTWLQQEERRLRQQRWRTAKRSGPVTRSTRPAKAAAPRRVVQRDAGRPAGRRRASPRATARR